MDFVLPLTYPVPADDLPVAVIAILAFAPIVIGLSIYFYATRHVRSWKKGVYPISLKFNQDNLLEAYLTLSARMIMQERGKRSTKIQFVNSYFNRYFPLANYNFSDSMVFSMRHPIQTETVCEWMKKHIPKSADRAQILFFLAGIASLKDEISRNERAFLNRIRIELELSEVTLERIYAIYASFKERNYQQESDTRKRPRNDQRKEALYREILGVNSSADEKTIKKAYRALVKIYHPDKLVDATDAQRKIAEDKFLEIQRAYEFFNEK